MQINSLTGFRAFAAGIVLIGHLINYKSVGSLWILKYGWVGVNFFFALSGFLFTFLYYEAFKNSTQSYRDYFLKRIFRIYPLYLFLLLITVLTQWKYSFGNIFTHLTMTHGLFDEYRFSINAPMWTLSVEEFYYFLVPFLLIFISNIDRIKELNSNVKKFSVITFVLITLMYVFKNFTTELIDFKQYLLMLQGIEAPKDLDFWSTTIFGRFSDFALGMIAGVFVLKFPKSKILSSNFISTSLFILGYVVFYQISAWVEARGGIKYANNEFVYSYYVRMYALGGTLMILSLYGNSIFRRIFEHKYFVYLGKISFSLYLCQFVGIGSIENLALYFKANAIHITYFYTEIGAVFIAFVGVSIIAALLHHFLEEPSQKYLRKRFLKSN